MNEPTIKDGITELGIFEKNMDALTTSLDIARVFEKPHDAVIKSIKKTIEDCDATFSAVNIYEAKYKDAQGKYRPCYNLTRKGFTLVAMGFSGKKAMDFKVRYINAFESMAELISSRIISKNGYKEMTAAIKAKIGDSPLIYAKEANMVNIVVLGMKSSDFKEVHGLKANETPRDSVIIEVLQELDKAQRLNSQLIIAGIDDRQRESILRMNYSRGK
jgi:Rha family phage regulatory protein